MDVIQLLKKIAQTPHYELNIDVALSEQSVHIKEAFKKNDNNTIREILDGDKNFSDRTTIFKY